MCMIYIRKKCLFRIDELLGGGRGAVRGWEEDVGDFDFDSIVKTYGDKSRVKTDFDNRPDLTLLCIIVERGEGVGVGERAKTLLFMQNRFLQR